MPSGVTQEDEQLQNKLLEFFSTPSVDRGYILGYTMADGCLTERQAGDRTYRQLTYHCVTSDVAILEYLKRVLKPHSSILSRDGGVDSRGVSYQPSSTLSFSARKLELLLANFGIVPRKSKVDSKFPTDLRGFEYPHYIRGYLDGDGSIRSITYGPKTKTPRTAITFYALSSFIWGLREHLVENVGVSPRSPCCHRSSDAPSDWHYSLSRLVWCHRRDIQKLYSYLYPNCDDYFFLARKKEILDEYLRSLKNENVVNK